MPYTPQGINPDDVPTPDTAALYQGPGMPAQAAPQLQLTPQMLALLQAQGQGQLPPGQLQQPQVAPPDVDQLLAARQQALRDAQPRSGATNPTTLNQEDYTKAQLQNLESRKDITKQQGDVLQKQYDQESSVQSQAAADQKLALLNDQLASQKAMQDATVRDNALMSQIQAAGKEQVDPNHWWNSKSTGGKISASIGMFLNGLGDPRIAHDQMNKAIDRDIDAQHENISNHWKSISDQANLGDRADLRAAHDMEYRNQFRIAGLEVVKQRLAAEAAGGKASMVGPNAQMAIQDINKQQDDLRKQNYDMRQKMLASQFSGQAAYMKRMQEQAKEAAAHQVTLMSNPTNPMSEKEAHESVGRMYPELAQSGLWTGGGGGGFSTTQPVSPENKKLEAADQKDLSARSVSLPDGSVAVARSKEDANATRNILKFTQQFDNQLDQLGALQKKYEAGSLTLEDRAKWQVIRGNMTNTYNELQDVKRQAGVGEGSRIEEDMLPDAPLPSWATNKPAFNPYVKPSAAKLEQMRTIVADDRKTAVNQLQPLSPPPGAAPSAADWSKLGFKPKVGAIGPVPKAIPNIQSTNQANSPGVPTWQQYNQGK